MTLLYVQFADDTEEVIISYFGSPNDPEVWPNQGTVEQSDPRWKTYWDAQPILIQRMLPLPTVPETAA